MNRENLKKLSDYLLSGNLKANFDMEEYSHCENRQGTTDCGSVGCAIGHGPFAGIPKDKLESWPNYGSVNFAYIFSLEWNWCFSYSWAMVDNTPEGAGLRIKWLLENGLPEDWKEQLEGKAKLCYK